MHVFWVGKAVRLWTFGAEMVLVMVFKKNKKKRTGWCWGGGYIGDFFHFTCDFDTLVNGDFTLPWEQ